MKLPDELKNQFSSLILFDGVCNLCNVLTAFVIQRDPKKKFRYASLQGKTGQRILTALHFPATELDTFIFIHNDHYYLRSTAALKVFRAMNGLWPLLYIFIVVPAIVRDFFYGILVKNRSRWFGKKDACLIPTPELKSLFLE